MLTSQWKKSSFSDTANCLEARLVDGETVELRESDAPGTVIRTTRANLAAWVAGAKAGEFD